MRDPRRIPLALVALLACAPALLAGELPIVEDVEFHALADQARGVLKALERSGDALPEAVAKRLETALQSVDEDRGVRAIQKALDEMCLIGVTINPESRVHATQGEASTKLSLKKRRVVLVKIHNLAGVTSELRLKVPKSAAGIDLTLVGDRPGDKALSGKRLEYKVVAITGREVGKREAKVGVDVGQGTEDLGSRSEVDILFDCRRGDDAGTVPRAPDR